MAPVAFCAEKGHFEGDEVVRLGEDRYLVLATKIAPSTDDNGAIVGAVNSFHEIPLRARPG